MSVSVETYIVISLMFAVFSAVAAVGTSVVLGAGFERLRAGFEVVKRQSGFFADAIYKLDQKTQLLDVETAKLKTGMLDVNDRVTRVEKTTMFIGDEMNAMQQRILEGSPIQSALPADMKRSDGMYPVHTVHTSHEASAPVMEISLPQEMIEDERGSYNDDQTDQIAQPEQSDKPEGLTNLLSQYFLGEGSGSGRDVVYH